MSFRLISSETGRARKVHRCTWCGQEIAIGETYLRIRCVFEGDAQTNKFHPECDAEVSRQAREEGGEFEFSPGEGERPPPLEPPKETGKP